MKTNQNGKLNIMVIVIIVVLQIVIAAALYFFVFAKNDEKIKPIKKEKVEEVKTEEGDGEKESGSKDAKDYLTEYAIYTVSDIVINPKGSPDSYLVVSIALEYQTKSENLGNELKNKDLLIKDKIIGFFSSKSKEELQLVENRDKYKSDLKKTINSLLKEGRVTNVLFSQFVMQ